MCIWPTKISGQTGQLDFHRPQKKQALNDVDLPPSRRLRIHGPSDLVKVRADFGQVPQKSRIR
jgi:hypothetical protein